MLVAPGGCEPQAKGHVTANLNVGNDRGVLIDVINPAAAVHPLPAHVERPRCHQSGDSMSEVIVVIGPGSIGQASPGESARASMSGWLTSGRRTPTRRPRCWGTPGSR